MPETPTHERPPPAHAAGRVTANTVAQLAALVLAALANLGAIPIVIDRLGTEGYGILVLLLAYLAFFEAIGAGIQLALVRELHRTSSAGPAAARAVLRTGTVVGTTFGLGSSAVTLLLAAATSTLGGPSLLAAPGDSLWSWAGAAATLLLVRSLSFIVSAPLVAAERIDILNVIRSTFELVRIAGMVAVLLRGDSLFSVLVVFVVAAILDGAVTARVASSYAPSGWLRPMLAASTLRRLLPFWRSTIVTNLSAWVQLEMDKFLFSAFLPLRRLPFYQVPFGLSQRIGLIATSLATSLFPTVSLRATGAGTSLPRIFLSSTKAVAILTVLPTVILFVYARELLELWIGPEFADQSSQPLRILAVGFLLNSLGRVPGATCQAIGHPRVTARLAVYNAGLGSLLLALLLPRFGIIGGAAAFTCVQAILIPELARRTCVLVQLRFSTWFREALLRTAGLGIAIGGALAALKGPETSPWVLAATATAAALLYAAIAARWVLTRDERQTVYQMLPTKRRAA